jgi:hypothetical protein
VLCVQIFLTIPLSRFGNAIGHIDAAHVVFGFRRDISTRIEFFLMLAVPFTLPPPAPLFHRPHHLFLTLTSNWSIYPFIYRVDLVLFARHQPFAHMSHNLIGVGTFTFYEHSQITATLQPAVWRASMSCRSLAMFSLNFLHQNPRWFRASWSPCSRGGARNSHGQTRPP